MTRDGDGIEGSDAFARINFLRKILVSRRFVILTVLLSITQTFYEQFFSLVAKKIQT